MAAGRREYIGIDSSRHQQRRLTGSALEKPGQLAIRREHDAWNLVKQHQQAKCVLFNPYLRFVPPGLTCPRQPQPARSALVKICVPRRNHRNAEPVAKARAQLTDVARTSEMQDVGRKPFDELCRAADMAPHRQIEPEIVLEAE